MKTIAIPVYGNRISNRLDCSKDVLLVYIENGRIDKRETYHWAQANPWEKIEMLLHLGVNILICDGITEFYANQLRNTPVKVIPWISGEVDEILVQYLEGNFVEDKLKSEGE